MLGLRHVYGTACDWKFPGVAFGVLSAEDMQYALLGRLEEGQDPGRQDASMKCVRTSIKTAYFPPRPCAHKSKVILVDGVPLCGMHRAALERMAWEAGLVVRGIS